MRLGFSVILAVKISLLDIQSHETDIFGIFMLLIMILGLHGLMPAKIILQTVI